MLAKRRSLKIGGAEIERTPLLVPSFSSKGFPEVGKILETAKEFIEGPLLISAYDIFHKQLKPPDFPEFLFLDSGGYEVSKGTDLSDLRENEHSASKWDLDSYMEVVKNWSSSIPTIVTSYDHPDERLPVGEQIARAKSTLPTGPRISNEMLFKPETPDQQYLKVDSVVKHIHELANFTVIGFTEKEIGSSVLERMKNIAHIRVALDGAGLDLPIQVYGSLDTVTTPLYFVAGADIFDGLTWLRFGYKDGQTLYRQNYGVLALGVDVRWHLIDARCWSDNYYYLKDLQLEMRRFLKDGDFSAFRYNSTLIRNAYNSVAEAVGV